MTDGGEQRGRVLDVPVLLVSLPFAFLNFSLPLRADNLGAGGLGVGALFAAFTALVLVLRPLVGIGLDRFGRRPFLCAALAIYVLAMLGFALVDSMAGLLVMRMLQGAGAALLWISARTLIADLAPADQRAEAMGRITERTVRGSIAGATVGFTLLGVLGLQAGWRWAFVAFAGAALLALALVWVRAPETLDADSRSAAPADGGAAPARRLDPLLLPVALLAAATSIGIPFMLLHLARVTGGQVMDVAAWLLPVALIMGIVPSRAGRLADRLGAMPLVPVALLVAGAGAGVATFAGAAWSLALGVSVLHLGAAFAEPALAARAGGADLLGRGRRYGQFELAAGFGAVVGPLLAGAAFDLHGIGAAMAIAAGGAAAAALVGVLALRRPPSPEGVARR